MKWNLNLGILHSSLTAFEITTYALYFRYMVMEIYSDNMDDIIKYYYSGADHPFNFNLINLNTSCGGVCIQGLINGFLDSIPDGRWPSHVV